MPGKGKFGIWPKKDKPPVKESLPDTPGGTPTKPGKTGGTVKEYPSGSKGREIRKKDK